MNIQRETSGHIAAIVTILIWGTTFISTKVLLADFSPMEILFYRFLMGFIALILVRPNMIPFRNWRQELLFAGAGLFGVTLYFLLENIALTYTYASNVGMIVSIIPMITAVLAHFLLEGEKLRLTFFIGFGSALIGLLLITFNGNIVLRLIPLGDIMAAGAALVFGGYSIFMKKLSAYEHHIIELTQRVFLYGLLFMVPALFLFDFHFPIFICFKYTQHAFLRDWRFGPVLRHLELFSWRARSRQIQCLYIPGPGYHNRRLRPDPA